MCPSLDDHEIHVWHVDLPDAGGTSSGLLEILSAEEIARAERFHFLHDREAYSTCKVALRHIQSLYLGVRPEKVQFSRGPHGKPQLGGVYSSSELQFNISHSRRVGLIAVARRMSVGVDVECVRPMPDVASIAESHFSRKEREELFRFPVSKLTEGFFMYWTRKEAYVKALGRGLSVPLNSFCVSTRPREAVTLLDESDNSSETLRWKVMDLRFDDISTSGTYVGALVGQGTRWRASIMKWQTPSPLLPAATSRE